MIKALKILPKGKICTTCKYIDIMKYSVHQLNEIYDFYVSRGHRIIYQGDVNYVD